MGKTELFKSSFGFVWYGNCLVLLGFFTVRHFNLAKNFWLYQAHTPFIRNDLSLYEPAFKNVSLSHLNTQIIPCKVTNVLVSPRHQQRKHAVLSRCLESAQFGLCLMPEAYRIWGRCTISEMGISTLPPPGHLYNILFMKETPTNSKHAVHALAAELQLLTGGKNVKITARKKVCEQSQC